MESDDPLWRHQKGTFIRGRICFQHVSVLSVILGLYCSRMWDGWLCWDDTPAGTITSQNCPGYFEDVEPTGEQREFDFLTLTL